MDKEKLIKHLTNVQDKLLIIRILEKAEKSIQQYIPYHTDFLDPYQINLGTKSLVQVHEIEYRIFGGVENAERSILTIYPDTMREEDVENPLGAIRIHGNFFKSDIQHRDVLGSVLGLGIKREKIGDILVGEGIIDLIAFKEICDFICISLEKISRYKVSVTPVSFQELMQPIEQFKCVSGTVNSLRLDSVIALGFGESRTQISKFIHGDAIKVNWKPVKNLATEVKAGDIISLKGKGRIILEEVGDRTKKERLKVMIKKLL